MLKLSKKVEYALISLMHMESLQHGDLANSREISENYNIPAELLGKVLQALARCGLINSIHGAKGGYRLARSADHITLGEVMEAVDGPVRLAECQSDPACCDQYANCNIKKPVYRVQRLLINYMSNLPIAAFRSSVDLPEYVAEGDV